MNTRMLAFVSVLALAAAMLLWFGRSSSKGGSAAHLEPQMPPATTTAASKDVQLPAVPERERELLETAEVEPESPAWTTAVPEDDGVTGWELAPLNVQVIDSLSGERVPFLSFTARDERGETLAGCTDIDGRVRGYEELSVGTVHVDLTIGAHADDLAFGGARTVRRGARLEQPKFPHGGDPEEPSVWEIKAQRLVPLKIDVPAPLLDHVEIWLASAAEEGAQQKSPLRVDQLKNAPADQLRGATHVIELDALTMIEARPGSITIAGVGGGLSDWKQERAGQRLVTRKLVAVVAAEGQLLVASTLVPELPLLGEAPVQMTPTAATAGALPGPILQAWYATELKLQAAATASSGPRQNFRLTGVVTSNTGEFKDTVFVRANPAGDQKLDGVERRKQWITVHWTRGADGRWTAPFDLDELDAGPYRITALTSDGAKFSGSPSSADPSNVESKPLRFTVLD